MDKTQQRELNVKEKLTIKCYLVEAIFSYPTSQYVKRSDL